jgi:hypothetical protein
LNEFLAFGPSTIGFTTSKSMSLSSGRKRGSFLVGLKEKVDGERYWGLVWFDTFPVESLEIVDIGCDYKRQVLNI